MKSPLKHIQETRIWMRLWEFFQSLRDLKQVRQFWRQMPLIRLFMSSRMRGRRVVTVRDYIVPTGEGGVERRALAARIQLRFRVGDIHDSIPPGSPVRSQAMRDISLPGTRTAGQLAEELLAQGLRTPRLSEFIDHLTAFPKSVSENDPLYLISAESAGQQFTGRIYRVLRASRTKLGVSIEMPTDLQVRKADRAILLPDSSRVLGVSPRRLADVLSIPVWSSTPDGSSEPA